MQHQYTILPRCTRRSKQGEYQIKYETLSKVEGILNEPSDRYIDVIKKGLISCGYDFSKEEYKKYFKNGERC